MLIASIKEKELGQIRFDKINSNSFEIDFSIDCFFRGKGIGSILIKGGLKELFNKYPLTIRVIGKVKRGNIPSKKSFLNAGFKQMESSDSVNEFDTYYFDNL